MDSRAFDVFPVLLNSIEKLETTCLLPQGYSAQKVMNAFEKIQLHCPKYFYLSDEYTYNPATGIIEWSYILPPERIEFFQQRISAVLTNEFQIDYVRSLTPREQLEFIFPRLLRHANYNLYSSYNDSILGVFVERTASSMGYAKAVKYLCDILGIESKIISGQLRLEALSERDNNASEDGKNLRHYWNQVCIDGMWYHLDVCFSDQNSLIQLVPNLSLSKMDALDLGKGMFCVSPKTHILDPIQDIPSSIASPSFKNTTHMRDHDSEDGKSRPLDAGMATLDYSFIPQQDYNYIPQPPSSYLGKIIGSTLGDIFGPPRIIDGDIVQRSERRSVFSRMRRKFFGSDKKQIEIQETNQRVNSCVYAPAQVKRDDHMLVQVYLYKDSDYDKVHMKAKMVDEKAQLRQYSPLEIPIKEGDKVWVELKMSDAKEAIGRKEFYWQGFFRGCEFDLYIPAFARDTLVGTVKLYVNELPAGEMLFKTNVVGGNPSDILAPVKSKRFEKVFVSYSHCDLDVVRPLVEGLRIANIDYFFDRHTLQGGDKFREVIKNWIENSDVFILCWSANAARSEEVKKEIDLALYVSQRDERLHIYPLSFAPEADLPGSMKDTYNFSQLHP